MLERWNDVAAAECNQARASPRGVFVSNVFEYLDSSLSLNVSNCKKLRFVTKNIFVFYKKQHGLIHFIYNKADSIITQTQEMKDEMENEIHIDEN